MKQFPYSRIKDSSDLRFAYRFIQKFPESKASVKKLIREYHRNRPISEYRMFVLNDGYVTKDSFPRFITSEEGAWMYFEDRMGTYQNENYPITTYKVGKLNNRYYLYTYRRKGR